MESEQVEERGLAPMSIPGPSFYPAWRPWLLPASTAVTIAGKALLMTAWVNFKNEICIHLEAAFPGTSGTVFAGIQNHQASFAVLPHVIEIGITYYAVKPDEATWQPGDSWQWFWWAP